MTADGRSRGGRGQARGRGRPTTLRHVAELRVLGPLPPAAARRAAPALGLSRHARLRAGARRHRPARAPRTDAPGRPRRNGAAASPARCTSAPSSPWRCPASRRRRSRCPTDRCACSSTAVRARAPAGADPGQRRPPPAARSVAGRDADAPSRLPRSRSTPSSCARRAARPAGTPYCEVEIERRAGRRRDLTDAQPLLQQRFGLIPSRASKFARGLAALYGADADVAARRDHSGRRLGRQRRRARSSPRSSPACALPIPARALGRDARAAARDARRRAPSARRDCAPSPPGFRRACARRCATSCAGSGRSSARCATSTCSSPIWPGTPRTAAPARRARRLNAVSPPPRARARRAPRRLLVAALDVAGATFACSRALERFAASPPPRATRRAATPRRRSPRGRRAVKRAMRKVMRRGDAIGELPEAEDLHALRIRAKRLRYLLEALKPITGSPGRKARQAARAPAGRPRPLQRRDRGGDVRPRLSRRPGRQRAR